MTLYDIKARLRLAWSAETSATPDEWSAANSARGQCAVTALVVQDVLGGELMRSTVLGESHYWNRLPNGREVDLTLEQFGGYIADAPPVERDRDYVLSFEETRRRYERLRQAAGL